MIYLKQLSLNLPNPDLTAQQYASAHPAAGLSPGVEAPSATPPSSCSKGDSDSFHWDQSATDRGSSSSSSSERSSPSPSGTPCAESTPHNKRPGRRRTELTPQEQALVDAPATLHTLPTEGLSLQEQEALKNARRRLKNRLYARASRRRKLERESGSGDEATRPPSSVLSPAILLKNALSKVFSPDLPPQRTATVSFPGMHNPSEAEVSAAGSLMTLSESPPPQEPPTARATPRSRLGQAGERRPSSDARAAVAALRKNAANSTGPAQKRSKPS